MGAYVKEYHSANDRASDKMMVDIGRLCSISSRFASSDTGILDFIGSAVGEWPVAARFLNLGSRSRKMLQWQQAQDESGVSFSNRFQ